MVNETYPCYVRIGDDGDSDIVELPTEQDGTMLLSTITAQYPDAIGLRYKSESGAWRGVRVIDGVLDAPLEGWGDSDYLITVGKSAAKRKIDDDSGPTAKKNQQEMLSDMIVLGLPYSAGEDDLKEYFEKFGDLAHWEVKMDRQTGKNKGFGFVRFTDVAAVEAVLAATHEIGGRKCEVRFPNREPKTHTFGYGQDGNPTKLFIGRLPRGATTEDLRECFASYGPLKDVYIPNNFRGFGFVTFPSQAAADAVMSTQHVVKGSYLNISFPSPKPGQAAETMPMQSYGGMKNMQGNMMGHIQGSMQSNMQHKNMQQVQTGSYGYQQPGSTGSYYSNGYYQYGSKVSGMK